MTEFHPEGTDQSGATQYGAAKNSAPQPYVQYVQQPAAAPTLAWPNPQALWTPPAPKKRKVWPWVLGIGGGLLVLGGAAAAFLVFAFAAVNADPNENYTGSPITEADAATLGDEVVVSDDGRVAYELGADWVDASEYVDTSAMSADTPEGGEYLGFYFTSDPTVTEEATPGLVMVLAVEGSQQVSPQNLAEFQEGFVDAFVESGTQSGVTVDVEESVPVTTAQGLDGLLSVCSAEVAGTPVEWRMFSFSRGTTLVAISVVAYNGVEDLEPAALVTDSLRIDY